VLLPVIASTPERGAKSCTTSRITRHGSVASDDARRSTIFPEPTNNGPPHTAHWTGRAATRVGAVAGARIWDATSGRRHAAPAGPKAALADRVAAEADLLPRTGFPTAIAEQKAAQHSTEPTREAFTAAAMVSARSELAGRSKARRSERPSDVNPRRINLTEADLPAKSDRRSTLKTGPRAERDHEGRARDRGKPHLPDRVAMSAIDHSAP
jgi:hypothetical protein